MSFKNLNPFPEIHKTSESYYFNFLQPIKHDSNEFFKQKRYSELSFLIIFHIILIILILLMKIFKKIQLKEKLLNKKKIIKKNVKKKMRMIKKLFYLKQKKGKTK